MKIIADDKIPFLKGVLEPFADIVYVPGSKIDKEIVRDADALIIRTRTCCNENLLKDSKVQFIGTATIGYDHIDTKWCDENRIIWKNAPGCNASSVNQYVVSALLNLSGQLGFELKKRVIGIVGVGNVGSKVVHTAETIGMRVYLCDPPRVRNQGACGFISLDGILRECDIITFHVPLNTGSIDNTYHLINDELLSRVNRGAIIINTSRGEIADTFALKKAIKHGNISAAVLDVWENEPEIDSELMSLCSLATPHIAGYSTDGKAKGTSMIINELSRHFDLPLNDWEPYKIPEPENSVITIDCKNKTKETVLKEAILHTYNVKDDDERLRKSPSSFEMQRGNYPLRREFKAYTLQLLNADGALKNIFNRLGFKVD